MIKHIIENECRQVETYKRFYADVQVKDEVRSAEDKDEQCKF